MEERSKVLFNAGFVMRLEIGGGGGGGGAGGLGGDGGSGGGSGVGGGAPAWRINQSSK
jgi:hypothetical protein